MLKVAGLILVAIAVLVGIVVLLGARLPISHVVSRQATYAVDRGTLFAVISDFDRMPEWRTGVTRVERLADREGHQVWREQSRSGSMPFEVIEQDPPGRMVTRILSEGLPFGGTWTYELSPGETGRTTLTITERGEVYNPVFRFVSRYFLGHDATAVRFLKDLAGRFETTVEPEDVAATG